ncbi:MAG TPA: universal stress protein [Terriglobia bacterium]
MSDTPLMVAVRDEKHVDELVKLACQMVKGTGTDLLALSVAEIAPALPIDAGSEVLDRPRKDALDRAAKVAWDAFGIRARTRLVRAREAGAAIVDEAKEQHASLLVMGYHGRLSIGEILLGSCVQYVAAHAPCRVILQIVPESLKTAG